MLTSSRRIAIDVYIYVCVYTQAAPVYLELHDLRYTLRARASVRSFVCVSSSLRAGVSEASGIKFSTFYFHSAANAANEGDGESERGRRMAIKKLGREKRNFAHLSIVIRERESPSTCCPDSFHFFFSFFFFNLWSNARVINGREILRQRGYYFLFA